MNGLGRAAMASRAALAQSSGATRNAALHGGGTALAREGGRHPRRQCARHGGGAGAGPERGHARSAAAERRSAWKPWRPVSSRLPHWLIPSAAVSAEWTRPNGLVIQRVRVPLGVIGIIYESRPNVTADAGALCLKSANPVILRGGSESRLSSAAIHDCLVAGLRAAGLPDGGDPAGADHGPRGGGHDAGGARPADQCHRAARWPQPGGTCAEGSARARDRTSRRAVPCLRGSRCRSGHGAAAFW